MNDLISRAAAIAEVEEYLQELDSCIGEPDLKLDGYKNGLQVAINELKSLPAVDAVPRVMTLEEALGAEVNVDQCWLEVNGIKQIYLADAVVCPEHTERADIQRWGASDCQLPLDLYGEYWRMWTSQPTDEQREAIPWE